MPQEGPEKGLHAGFGLKSQAVLHRAAFIPGAELRGPVAAGAMGGDRGGQTAATQAWRGGAVDAARVEEPARPPSPLRELALRGSKMWS